MSSFNSLSSEWCSDAAVTGVTAGHPWPLGVQVAEGPHGCGGAQTLALNFAVWAPDATRVQVCVFDDTGVQEVTRWDLPACTDGVWHGRWASPQARPGLVYGLRAHGPWDPARGHRFNPAKVLLDPWAEAVVGRYAGHDAQTLSLYQGHHPDDPSQPDPRDNAPQALKARVIGPRPVVDARERPAVPADQRVLYEAHVRALTQRHPDIPAPLRGSYAALAHPAMLAHYRALGVTTLSLQPVHARADEARLQLMGLSNHWGYTSIGFLAPEPRYWSGQPDTTPEGELRQAIADLHAAGLEVVLDVVYNHTAETDEHGPTLSMRGLANARYYRLQPGQEALYVNWAGCGNCLNLAEPRVVEMVLGSMRHWVQVYGVDGFRFDLAPILARDRQGHFDRSAGFFAALQADPVLSRVICIAEPWDIGPNGYQLGGFPPGWAEWNDQYRDTMRAWWLRQGGDRGVFAHRFAGSSAQFHHDQRRPTASVNFITAHDGFTLRDLVSHDHKHNHANGEHNRDGHHHNSSWNAGVEGETADPVVLTLRLQLQRALLATLLLSQGTPMLLAGDELGHSQRGNNNAYCQDNELTWLNWAAGPLPQDMQACVQRLLQLRRTCAALRQGDWLTGQPDVQGRVDVRWWHPQGRPLQGTDWAAQHERGLMIELHGADGSAALLLLNPDAQACTFNVGGVPGQAWQWPLAFHSHAPGGDPALGLAADCTDSNSLHLRQRVLPARCVLIYTNA